MTTNVTAQFDTTYEERTPVELSVSGNIPAFAAGTLFRTGAGVREIKDDSGKAIYKVNHWFDGLAQVHRFQILPPDDTHSSVRVIYNSRSTCDGLIEKVRKAGKLEGATFGAKYDPCVSMLGKVMSVFNPRDPDKSLPDEESMSVTLSVNYPGLDRTAHQKTGKHGSGVQTLCNKTDRALLQMLDPETLEPIGLAKQEVLHPSLKGRSSAAHAKSDPETGDVYNYNLEFGRVGTYRVFKANAQTGKTSVLATIPYAPAYLHSLFLTKNYVILCVWNSFFAAGGLKILWNQNIVDAIAPFDASTTTKWFVVDRKPVEEGGKGLVATYESEPFYCFHTLNAFEEPSTNGNGVDIVADLCAYENLDCIKRFYIDNLMSDSPKARKYSDPANLACRPQYKRFRLPSVPTASTKKVGKVTVDFALDRDLPFELPTLNSRMITKRHRYVYGVSDTGKSSFFDGLVKYDLETKAAKPWQVHAQSAGEPIFVPRTKDEKADEDDGVLLSVVLDGTAGKSYLLVLDAKTMTEVGRASVNGAVGYGFHGTYVPPSQAGIHY